MPRNYSARGSSSRGGPRRPSGNNRNQQRRGPQQSNRKGPKKEYIHPSKFIKPATISEKKAYEPTHSFADFDLHNTLAANVQKRNFKTPSAIQDQFIPHGLAGRDVIGIANTGTGKTIAFAIPVLNKLMFDSRSSAIIITPTRELAEQVLDECRTLAEGGKVRWALLIGGSPMKRQLQDMARRPNLVIGTPGRIKDHIERGSLDTRHYNILVLDEVDRMLDMGFVNDMRGIAGGMPDEKQSFFLSATMNTKVRSIIDDFSHDPVGISVDNGDTSENVEQGVVTYHDDAHKIDQLKEIIDRDVVEKVLIFDETRGRVERLSKTLINSGVKAESIHGGRSQGQRKRALNNFKEDRVKVLVATDVAARGIDVVGITHVINYATPQSYSDYVHRIGRAGRAGKIGYALTFIEG